MSDISNPVIKRLTKRSLMYNKKRNFFIVMSIMLTTLLLASVFSIGMGFINTLNMQGIRLMGTVAHATITRPSADELEQLRNFDYIEKIGTSNHVARIQNTSKMGNMSLALHYFDKIEWEEMRSPTLTDINGHYPQVENEIMVPLWVLEKLEITPEIGMEIPLTYTVETNDGYSQHDKVFILSGWFKSYVHIRTGNIDVLPVSEALSRLYDKTVENNGSVSVTYKNIIPANNLRTEDSPRLQPVPALNTASNTDSVTRVGFAIIVVLLLLTGYLLIYNVLYISVANDVRFYGLLKTIGATPRQIGLIVIGQILRLCAIAIPLGLAAAAMLSLVIVPAVIGISSVVTGVVVSFSPIIFIGAFIFSLLTALLGAAKPAIKAAVVSPVEAQKYTGLEMKKSAVYSCAHGKLYRMALRNIFRDRKRAAVVFISLFLGITTFNTIITIVASMDSDNFVAMYAESDFVLTNNTVFALYNTVGPKQKFDDNFLELIGNLQGCAGMQYDTTNDFYLTYTDEFQEHFQMVIDNRKKQGFMISPYEIAYFKENFNCVAVGVDVSALATFDNGFDIEAFEQGEYLLLSVSDPSLLAGIETVEIRSKPEGSVITKVSVGGFAPPSFHNHGSGYAPTLIISHKLMERLSSGAIRSKLYIDVAKGTDEQFLAALKTLMDNDYEISRDSQIEWRETLRDGKMVLYILGGGMAFALGLAGVLNFVNVMSVGIVVRRREFATLESIGMSRRQLRKMLRWEGIGYAIITLILVSSLGNAISYGLFKLFQIEANYTVFTYPIVPVVLIALAILIICIITPEIAYRSANKTTIVERLRETE